MSTTMSNRDVQIDEAVTTAADRLWPKAQDGQEVDISGPAFRASRMLDAEYGLDMEPDVLERKIESKLYRWASHGR